MTFDGHAESVAIDQPGKILENEIPPLREFGRSFTLEERFAGPIIERNQHAVVGDNHINRPVGILRFDVDHTVKAHRDSVEIFLFGRGSFGRVFRAGFGVYVTHGRLFGLVFEYAGVPCHPDFGRFPKILSHPLQ